MMTQDTGAPETPNVGSPKSRKRLVGRVLLIGSLTLNVVIVGLVVGAVFSFKKHDGPSPVGDRFTAPFVRALSHEDKREVGREIRRGFRSASVDRRADDVLYLDVLDLLRETPFNAPAMKATMETLDQTGINRREIARESYLKRISSMSDAERAAYADRLEEELKRGHKGGHRDGKSKKKHKSE
ncbi:periplasmic heavy metal sensor [Shimia sp. R10_1]|uniref:periplasmic heavy metal sensor n=1 Tax=Shimia sp. R10_1 TaxID=2821095 RepID=UPI001AD9AF39|nr:periplasmic heavy metal sensor [Shimia sp. R10_1]MBO9472609.1 periplasmic heavy metal sensor [Shimia sp. R10_1]